MRATPIARLGIILLVGGLLLVCVQRYRARHPTRVFQIAHCVLGLSLPLCFQAPDHIDTVAAQRGLMVRINSVDRADGGVRIKSMTKEQTIIHTYIDGSSKTPKAGQFGWIAGPCKVMRQFRPLRLTAALPMRCKGPFYPQHGQPSPPAWRNLKSEYIQALDTVKHHDARAILKAITLGDKREISGVLNDTFTHVGANHLLAISGLHVAGMAALFCSVLIAILALLGCANPKPIAIIASCCLAYCMLLMSNGPVGAMRSFLTYSIVGVMTILGRRTDAVEILFMAATVMVLEQPDIWRQVGFQLSFMSVLSIVTLINRGALIPQALAVSLWSTVATAPLCAYYFGTVVPIGVLTNLLLVPFTPIVLMPSAWVGLWLMPITPIPLEISGEIAHYFVAILEHLHELGCHMLVIGIEHTISISLISLGACLITLHRAYACAIILAGVISFQHPSSDAVHFLDIGQGDATLVMSKGQTALLDAGPKHSGERLVRICRQLGVSVIDVLVMSHQHPDHFEGLESVIGRIRIKRLIVPHRKRSNDQIKHIERKLAAYGTRIETLDRDPIRIGRFSLHLYPPNPKFTQSENDASIAVHIEHREGDIMIMGDLERKGETHLIKQGPPRVDILRAGHHGSRTSTHSALLNTLCPSQVVVSLGYDNRFGFPHSEVTQRIRRHRAGLWRTDLDGRIVVSFDAGLHIMSPNQETVTITDLVSKQRCQPAAKTAFN